MSVVNAKDRSPKSLRYNCWSALPFLRSGASGVSTSQGAYLGLGLNMKLTHIAYTIAPTYTEGGYGAFNVESGYVADGSIPAQPQSSHCWILLAGAYAVGDTITVTLANVALPITVTVVAGDNFQRLAAKIAAKINANQAASAIYLSNSLGAEVVIQTLAYSTATPAFSVTLHSTSGTATTSGSNMIAGVAASLPTQPPSDQTSIGIVPSGTAQAGNCLFPCGIVLPVFNTGHESDTGTLYAVKNFDAIWPTAATLTAYLTNGGGGGEMTVFAYGVPIDNAPTKPQDGSGVFRPSQFLF